jgi:hypothetical protein
MTPCRRVTAAMLLGAAGLDLTRCGVAVATIRPTGEAALLVCTGLSAAGVSLWTARGCRRGSPWSGWAAFLIGAASAPQAAASGFTAAYAIPDAATAAVGVLVAVGVLATAWPGGRTSPPEFIATAADGEAADAVPTDGEPRCFIVLPGRSRLRTPT